MLVAAVINFCAQRHSEVLRRAYSVALRLATTTAVAVVAALPVTAAVVETAAAITTTTASVNSGGSPTATITIIIIISVVETVIGGFNPNFHWAGKRFWLEQSQRNWQCATTLYGGNRKIPERLRKKYLKILCQLCISVAISVLLFAIVHTVYIPNFSGFGSVSAEILAEM